VQRQTILSQHVRGSHDEHLTLRTVQRGRVEFDGNPSKFLQGHNLCGSDDLPGLVAAALVKAFGLLGLDVPPDDLAQWLAGDFELSRVDVTSMFELQNRADVRAWIRAASELGQMKWRGRGQMSGSTLYFGKVAKGKRGSTWSLKIYCKADELDAVGRSHKLHPQLPLRDELTAWVQNKLRAEVMLRGQELKRYCGGGLLRASEWNLETATVIFRHYFGKLQLGTNIMLATQTEDTLKPAVRLAYTAWKDGHDLRALLPTATFYRYRKQVLEMTGGDIDLLVTKAKSNVVPLVRVLELQAASTPDFLADRPDLLFRRAA
jgi:II/X family phage/plasmid replication protein